MPVKIVLVAIDAKYIHPNLALRYLRAISPLPCELWEYTIKDDFQQICADLIACQPDLIAFSVYIWNVEIVMKLIDLLKPQVNARIVCGGPEVSYEPAFFLQHHAIDWIVCGEGEPAFPKLVNALSLGTPIEHVPNLVWIKEGLLVRNQTELVTDLASLPNPYHFPEDLPTLSKRIQYVESSRGCPFHCSYCLASLDNSVRFFPQKRVQDDLLWLMDHGAKTFKFLDRTFNVRIDYAKALFAFLIEHHKEGTVFQFEITGDILPADLIEYVNQFAPKGLFRFEIGIQSLNVATAILVDRKQNNERLFDAIHRILAAGVIDLHLDLIAGLPEENLASFANTFDAVFSLYAKELQLGFLKMLRGTKLRRQAKEFGYQYHNTAPYEITENAVLTPEDLEIIHRVEIILEIFWNKGFLNEAFALVAKKSPSVFWMMKDLYDWHILNQYALSRYQLSEVFEHFLAYVESHFPTDAPLVFAILKKQYLLRHLIKPKIWWKDPLFPKRHELLREYATFHNTYSIDFLYKYAVVTDFLDAQRLIVFYLGKKTTFDLF